MAATCPGREAVGSRPWAAPTAGYAHICTAMVHYSHDLDAMCPFPGYLTRTRAWNIFVLRKARADSGESPLPPADAAWHRMC